MGIIERLGTEGPRHSNIVKYNGVVYLVGLTDDTGGDAKEQADWKIPPSISNWKNPKGYTIPLDKRLAADGRGLQEVQINDNFARLSEALYLAEQKAREAVETRARIQHEILSNEKAAKEDELRELAQRARVERVGGPDLEARPRASAVAASDGDGPAAGRGGIATGFAGTRDGDEPSSFSPRGSREKSASDDEARREREAQRAAHLELDGDDYVSEIVESVEVSEAWPGEALNLRNLHGNLAAALLGLVRNADSDTSGQTHA